MSTVCEAIDIHDAYKHSPTVIMKIHGLMSWESYHHLQRHSGRFVCCFCPLEGFINMHWNLTIYPATKLLASSVGRQAYCEQSHQSLYHLLWHYSQHTYTDSKASGCGLPRVQRHSWGTGYFISSFENAQNRKIRVRHLKGLWPEHLR